MTDSAFQVMARSIIIPHCAVAVWVINGRSTISGSAFWPDDDVEFERLFGPPSQRLAAGASASPGPGELGSIMTGLAQAAASVGWPTVKLISEDDPDALFVLFAVTRKPEELDHPDMVQMIEHLMLEPARRAKDNRLVIH